MMDKIQQDHWLTNKALRTVCGIALGFLAAVVIALTPLAFWLFLFVWPFNLMMIPSFFGGIIGTWWRRRKGQGYKNQTLDQFSGFLGFFIGAHVAFYEWVDLT